MQKFTEIAYFLSLQLKTMQTNLLLVNRHNRNVVNICIFFDDEIEPLAHFVLIDFVKFDIQTEKKNCHVVR